MSATAELLPMGTITAQLGQRIEVATVPRAPDCWWMSPALRWKAIDYAPALAATDAADWLTVGDGRHRWLCRRAINPENR